MPNWTYSYLEVTTNVYGDAGKAELERFYKAATEPNEKAFLNNLVPMPEELVGIETGGCTIDGVHCTEWRSIEKDGKFVQVRIPPEELADLKERFGAVNWYDWCNANWGCKWDASDLEIHLGDECLTASFQTPWSYPHEAMIKIAKQWPNLTFRLYYEDEDASKPSYVYGHGRIQNRCICGSITSNDPL